MTAPRIISIRPDASLVAALRRMADRDRCELEICAGDVDAVRRARARSADVVITDPATPIEEDLALVAELAAVRPAVRSIVLAPFAVQADVVAALRAHVFACFTPPIDDDEVAAMASSALHAGEWSDSIQVVSGADHWLTLRVSCHLLTADRLVRFMTELQPVVEGTDRDLLIAAFREMLLNAMEHGEGFDRGHLQHATVSPEPEAVLTTALARAEQGLRPGGFGMLIARQVADELVYNEPGNEVLLIKHLA